MQYENAKVSVNKRLCYVLGMLAVILPVIVGVLVWRLLPQCDDEVKPATDAQTGSQATSTTTLQVCVTSTPDTLPDKPWEQLRMPTYINPIHYEIELKPDFYDDNGVFSGIETIELNVTNDTPYLMVHIRELTIARSAVKLFDGGTDLPIKQTFFNQENEFWVVEMMQPIKSGTKVNLYFEFNGSLVGHIVGFYKSTYVNTITNQTRALATSKFEPTHARRAFPSFDEPNIKAEYTITLIHKDGYTALSNMPEESMVTQADGWIATRFQRSVRMSTYLVCFIVCDFAKKEAVTSKGKLVRVFATPDRIDQADYALEVVNHTLNVYEDLFKLPFPLPKQDMIAIPDFVSGAMEHWGLITYREVNMLYDPMKASKSNKQRVLAVITHELAHQWFGNIVTMDWWDDLWLNEGFASFVEYIGANSMESTWDMFGQAVIGAVQPIMITDSGLNSHPIVVDVNHPDEINEVFDGISYSKGSSIIRMLENIMGKSNFFKGIEIYLRRFEWGNARTDDLWQALSEVEGAPNVKKVMDTWTKQMGFPVVTISLDTSDHNNIQIMAKQKRFLADPSAVSDEESPFGYKWYVYLDFVTSDDTLVNTSSQTKEMRLNDITFPSPVDLTDPLKWIKFNVQETGFYRVNYPEDLWQRFGTMLTSNPSLLDAVDRSNLIDDAFNLARGSLLPYNVALGLTSYLTQENHYIPWRSVSRCFDYIGNMLMFTGGYGRWSQYVVSRVKPVLVRMGWEGNDGHLNTLLRSRLITLACGYFDRDCLRNASTLLMGWIDNGKTISPDLRSVVYHYGMAKEGTAAVWDVMWQKYMDELVPQERIKILYGLANTRSVWLLSRYLEYAMDESKVRSQDFFTVISYIRGNPVGRGLVWEFVRAKWELIVKRFGIGSRSLGRMVPGIVSHFNTEFHLQEVKTFFEKYPDAGSGERGRKQALETIETNIAWIKANQEGINSWLDNYAIS